MEIRPSDLSIEDWEKLEKTAEEIISNATRDLILWTNVLKEVVKQKGLKNGKSGRHETKA